MISVFETSAQSDSTYTVDYLSRSTKFAWLTLGAELFSERSGTTQLVRGGQLTSVDFNAALTPRLTIGGIHFWGHADFYVTFPLNFVSLGQIPSEFETLRVNQGIETGARIYPLKLQPGRLSPFAGVSFNTMSFQQENKASDFSAGTPKLQKVLAPLEFGITYTTDKYHISASAYYNVVNEFDYFVSSTQQANIQIDPVSFSLKFFRYWDTDKSMRKPTVVRQLNKMHDILDEEGLLSAWYWGIGPSAGIQMSRSSFLENNFPFLADQRIGGFMPDVSFGRFFAQPDMNVGFSYRTMGETLSGFDTKIQLRRHSFMLESYKNLFDWLGFVPYIGVTGSIENLRMDVNGVSYSDTKPAVGLIFGWDIRVTNTGTSLLRTNLRWIPNLHLEVEGDKVMFDNLEFNFIQYVRFIGRNKTYKKRKVY